jgi:hypothetical protein
MALRDLVHTTLELDATLMATLTGGLYAGGEISRQDTPAAFDANGEVLPCGLIADEVEGPYGPYGFQSTGSRAFFTVTFYQRDDYTSIDAALARAYTLLHGVKIGSASDHVWRVDHADDSADLRDPGLDCAMKYSRYVVYRLR